MWQSGILQPASIPSPSGGTIDIGPLSIHAYGLMIAFGVVAGVWLLGRRFEERGVATRDDASSIAVRAVIAGVIGARLYHVITDWQLFEDDLAKIPQIWKGGLGIPGGLIAGVGVGLWEARKRGITPGIGVTCAAPALALAQAIGRWGNWFNQELFGKPTDLPWALEVSDAKTLGAGYPVGTTFHPTFLYESLWNFALCGLLLWLDRRFRLKLRPGVLFAMYVAGYGIGRFWVEGLRIDPAKDFGGLRLNQWTSIVAAVLALGWILWASGRPQPEPALAGVAPDDDEPDDDDPVDGEPLDDEELLDEEALDDEDPLDEEPVDEQPFDDEDPVDVDAADEELLDDGVPDGPDEQVDAKPDADDSGDD